MSYKLHMLTQITTCKTNTTVSSISSTISRNPQPKKRKARHGLLHPDHSTANMLPENIRTRTSSVALRGPDLRVLSSQAGDVLLRVPASMAYLSIFSAPRGGSSCGRASARSSQSQPSAPRLLSAGEGPGAPAAGRQRRLGSNRESRTGNLRRSFSPRAVLALGLLSEVSKKEQSKFWPYLRPGPGPGPSLFNGPCPEKAGRILPGASDLHIPLLWPEEDRRWGCASSASQLKGIVTTILSARSIAGASSLEAPWT